MVGQKPNYDLILFGLQALEKIGILDIKYPIEHGIIKDWDDMEKFWNHTFTTELRVDPSEHNVLLTEVIMNPKVNREKTSQIMFEKFNVPGLYLANSPALSLYSHGKFTGIVVDSGEGVTQIVPIFDNKTLPHSFLKMDFGGRDITNYLIKNLEENGVSFRSSGDKYFTNKYIKEKTCYVALDFEQEKSNYKEIEYEMPDGTIIKVKDQRFRAPEILFHPEMFGKEPGGIGQKCNDSIIKSDIDKRKDLYKNIVLSGGTTLFSGFPERITKEIKNLAQSMKLFVKVIADPVRKYSAWIGGSVLTNLNTFNSEWITKDEYNEYGASIVHQKCI